MTPKLSLITVVAGVALLLAAPAWGQSQPQRSPDAADAAVANVGFNYLGADWAESRSSWSPNRSPDVIDRAIATAPSFNYVGSTYADTGRPTQVISGDDHVRLDPADLPTYVTTTSGREVEWPQIGVGLGLGMLLTLGVVLGMHFTRVRRLAH
jgi:hypothetical protein